MKKVCYLLVLAGFSLAFSACSLTGDDSVEPISQLQSDNDKLGGPGGSDQQPEGPE